MNAIRELITQIIPSEICIATSSISSSLETSRENSRKNTPSTTRTNSPDIEDQYQSQKNLYREHIIQKNVKDTPEGFVYSNGHLVWINKKPHYVVKMRGYDYYGYRINIYYELFGNFDVKIGFYDINGKFIELDIDHS